MSEFELYPPPLYPSTFSPIPDDLNFQYPMPLTPSDFSSSEDTAIYSPRSSVSMPAVQPEKTHATSGVSHIGHSYCQTALTIHLRGEELKIALHNEHSASAKRSMPGILKYNYRSSRSNIGVSRHHIRNSLPPTKSFKRHSRS